MSVPTSPGVYWWYFPEECLERFCIRELCELSTLNLRRSHDGKVCMYHGMATNLRERIQWHAAQKLAMSALSSGFLSTFRLTVLALSDFEYGAGEREIDGFMDQLEVEWQTHESVTAAEAAETAELGGPYHYALNIQNNRRPELAAFSRYLQDTRRNYRARFLDGDGAAMGTVRTDANTSAEAAQPRLEPPVLALISCTKSKMPHACRAAELYRPSPFFRLAYAFAGMHAQNTLILSAKHGLVHPNHVLEPYEQTLVGASQVERRRWAEMVYRQLSTTPEYEAARTLLWLAGKNYRAELLPMVTRDGKHSAIPLAHLRQLEQVAWLRDAVGRERKPASAASGVTPRPVPVTSSLSQVRDEVFDVLRAMRGPGPGAILAQVSVPPSRTRESSGQGASPKPATQSRGSRSAAPSAYDFRAELARLKDAARRRGAREVSVSAGELHRAVGGYPGPTHRMPICCSVMRQEMGPTDRILAQPPKGNGASLSILYQLT